MAEKNTIIWIIGIIVVIFLLQKPESIQEIFKQKFVSWADGPDTIGFVIEDNIARVEQIKSDYVCGNPLIGTTVTKQYQKMGGYALFIDNVPYYCEESFVDNGQTWGSHFLCNTKEVSKRYGAPETRIQSPVWEGRGELWDLDVGNPVPYSLADLKGEHVLVAYVHLHCPGMIKTAGAYFDEATIKRIERVVDFGGEEEVPEQPEECEEIFFLTVEPNENCEWVYDYDENDCIIGRHQECEEDLITDEEIEEELEEQVEDEEIPEKEDKTIWYVIGGIIGFIILFKFF